MDSDLVLKIPDPVQHRGLDPTGSGSPTLRSRGYLNTLRIKSAYHVGKIFYFRNGKEGWVEFFSDLIKDPWLFL